VASFNWLAASVHTVNFVTSFAIDERYAAVVARISYTDGIGMVRAFSFETLVTAHLWLDGRISADGTKCPLL
jgi:hypothetical protein